ncbi:MAG: hypothetical protein ACI4PM_04300 [Butyricicoccus sp.]
MGKKTHLIFRTAAMFLLAILLVLPCAEAQAATVRTGTYQRHYTSSTSPAESYRTVIIRQISSKTVRMQVAYDRAFPFRTSYSNHIVGKRTGEHTVRFTCTESYGNLSGSGIMKMYKTYVKIKLKSDGFLDTDGKYIKLKRISSSKKYYET